MSFRPGEAVFRDGIYRVVHGEGQLVHEVTLLAGDTFPRCQRCGDNVRFELLRLSKRVPGNTDFRVHLYQLPHPRKTGA